MTELLPFTAPPPLPPDPIPPAPALSPAAKAAIVVRLLLNEGADLPLEELPDALQVRLTEQMSQMRTVDRLTLQAVAQEFAEAVDGVALHFPPGIAGALDVLDGTISKHTADRLRREAGVRQYGDPWKRLAELGEARLAPLLEKEAVEVSAVALSKLPVNLSARVLEQLPGPLARRIAYAVSLTTAVTPQALDRIGLSLASQLDAQPDGSFADGPVQRVGAILNSSTNVTRTDVLTGLDETDAGFAREVRKAIFTFAHIPKRVSPRDVPRLLREVEGSVLLTALAGAPELQMEEARDFLLSNMSQRLADQLREEIAEKGKVKAAETEEAMAQVVQTLRDMEERGDLMLMTDEDED